MPMQFDLFLPPLFTAFALTIGFSLLFLSFSWFQRPWWRQGERHAKKEKISRLGGAALVVGFGLTVLLDAHLVISREILGLLIGGVLIGFVGLWDDFQELSFKVQGFFQVAITAVVFIFGIRITTIKNPFGEVFVIPEEGVFAVMLGFLVLLCWMVLVLNAVNWLDGLDGLLGSVSCLAFLTVFFLSLKPEVNQPPVALLALTAAGCALGFLFFNLHPARILAGTAGSLFLGFLIAVLAVIAGTKIATALLVLALPIVDAVWVIGERLRAGVSVFQSDQRHLHYKLRELGWSEGHIAWFFSLFTGLIAVIALLTESVGKFVALLLILSLILLFLSFVAERTKKQKHIL